MWKCKECGGTITGDVEIRIEIGGFSVEKDGSINNTENSDEILEQAQSEIGMWGADSYSCEDCCEFYESKEELIKNAKWESLNK